MVSIDDISLKVIDGDVKKFEHALSNMRVAILKMLCLEKLLVQEAKSEDMKLHPLDGKKT